MGGAGRREEKKKKSDEGREVGKRGLRRERVGKRERESREERESCAAAATTAAAERVKIQNFLTGNRVSVLCLNFGSETDGSGASMHRTYSEPPRCVIFPCCIASRQERSHCTDSRWERNNREMAEACATTKVRPTSTEKKETAIGARGDGRVDRRELAASRARLPFHRDMPLLVSSARRSNAARPLCEGEWGRRARQTVREGIANRNAANECS